ncbi:hypothetical protein SSPO_000540 [Streptomyces antimycoticus]|uniref:Carrier domain-containing protein n=1 Tax=Streptomyces antimycoticus TaxID=68175 RepID=A0A499UKH2_9ACTN|nr:condensation domain-containing protein [Streptomyces antimycoticus]BBJ37336.1 hypothetical protein SSPO_000540 [Streptomyces antimycoticus]
MRQAADEHRLPLKSLLLAVHLRVLAEESGSSTPLTGLVASARPAEEGGDRTLGLFLNTLPLCVGVASRSLLQLAELAWQAERDMMGHHTCPLADIERELGRGPLFDVFFNYTKFHRLDGPVRHTSRSVDGHGVSSDVAFCLTVDFEAVPVSEEVRFTLQYDRQRLDEHRIAAMAHRYTSLLEALVETPSAPLPPVERTAAADDEHAAWPERVAHIWQRLTGAAPGTPESDFFDVGGTSLLALRFVATLRDQYGITVELGDFNRARRYGALVELVRHGRQAPT